MIDKVLPFFRELPKNFLLFLKKGGWFFFLMFFLDLSTKLGMNAYFGNPSTPSNPDVVIFPDWLKLTLVYNTGAAYGAGGNMGPAMRIVFACVSFAVGCAIVYVLARFLPKIDAWKRYALYLILAGDWGNFIDRAFYWNPEGIYGVIDWISVGEAGWPSFLQFVCNWADVCLTFGAIVLAGSYLVDWGREFAERRAKEREALKKVEGKTSSREGEEASYATAEERMEKEMRPSFKGEKGEEPSGIKEGEKEGERSPSEEGMTEPSSKGKSSEGGEDDVASLSDFLKGGKG